MNLSGNFLDADNTGFGIMTEIIRVVRVICVERMNAAWYKLNMDIYLRSNSLPLLA